MRELTPCSPMFAFATMRELTPCSLQGTQTSNYTGAPVLDPNAHGLIATTGAENIRPGLGVVPATRRRNQQD